MACSGFLNREAAKLAAANNLPDREPVAYQALANPVRAGPV
jgi:hypothetical protein